MRLMHPSPRMMALTLVSGLLASSVLAQGLYRSVGPDGTVSYSDKPPATAATPAKPVGNTGAAAPAGAASGGQLPFELRQVANRFPVTLYTSNDCAPCNSGRNLLNARGIPYAEKTVNTVQDGEALKRLSGEASLPFLTIGGQQIKGYSDGEWTQFLDAAGYPKQSALPSSYRRPDASPLVAARPATSATPAAASRSGTAAPAGPADVPVTAPPQNPAGIRF